MSSKLNHYIEAIATCSPSIEYVPWVAPSSKCALKAVFFFVSCVCLVSCVFVGKVGSGLNGGQDSRSKSDFVFGLGSRLQFPAFR